MLKTTETERSMSHDDLALTSSAEAYDAYMGRYTAALAPMFADIVGVCPPQRALDVGCGPGALTAVLTERLGPQAVAACDISPAFVRHCSARLPGVDVRQASVAALPYPDGSFETVVAQFVLHFVLDPVAAAREMARVVTPDGRIGICVWDSARGMQLLRVFAAAALHLDEKAPQDLHVMPFGRPAQVAELLAEAGLTAVAEETLTVTVTHRDFDEVWAGFQHGIGPAGRYCARLGRRQLSTLKREFRHRLGSPDGQVVLDAVARVGVACRADPPV